MVSPPRPTTLAGAVVVAGAIPATLTADAPATFGAVVFLVGVAMAALPASTGGDVGDAWKPPARAGAAAGSALAVGALAAAVTLVGANASLLPVVLAFVGALVACGLGAVLGAVAGAAVGVLAALAPR